MNFKPGDTVQLKSGGPIMTVGSEENGFAMCYWFNGNTEEKSAAFPAATLKAATPGSF